MRMHRLLGPGAVAAALIAGCSLGSDDGSAARPSAATPGPRLPDVVVISPDPDPPSAAPTTTSAPPSSPSAVVESTPVPEATASPATPSKRPAPADLLAAVTAEGDVVLVDPNTAQVVFSLVSHDVGGPATSVSWDAARRVVYFGRAGECASVWRYRMETDSLGLISDGHHPAVSPDGRSVAMASGCHPAGESAGITIRNAVTGEVTHEVPLAAVPETEPKAPPRYVSDIDWRPDGKAVIVTTGWEGANEQRVVDLAKPPKSVSQGVLVRMLNTRPEKTYEEIEHVAERMLVTASCCAGGAPGSTQLFVRNHKTGELTPAAAAAVFSLTADPKGRVRYLDSGTPSRDAAALWALNRVGAPPRRIGGAFLAVSW